MPDPQHSKALAAVAAVAARVAATDADPQASIDEWELPVAKLLMPDQVAVFKSAMSLGPDLQGGFAKYFGAVTRAALAAHWIAIGRLEQAQQIVDKLDASAVVPQGAMAQVGAVEVVNSPLSGSAALPQGEQRQAAAAIEEQWAVEINELRAALEAKLSIARGQ